MAAVAFVYYFVGDGIPWLQYRNHARRDRATEAAEQHIIGYSAEGGVVDGGCNGLG